jgi:hypothetical protein
MTDEQILQEIQSLSQSLDKLANATEPLTREEKRRHQILLLQKQALEKIQKARQQNNASREVTGTIEYGLLTSFGEKHPILMNFVRSKMGLHF